MNGIPGLLRRRRRLFAALAVVALLTLAHPLLLPLLAQGLISNDPLAPADAIVFEGSNGPFDQLPLDEVAGLYRRDLAKRVVFIEDRSARVVRLGIVPSIEPLVRRELSTRGLPEDSITTLAVTDHGETAGLRCLRDWLIQNPEARVIYACGSFNSRRCAWRLRQVAGEQDAARVAWHALDDSRFTADNWWKSRQGIVQLAGAYLALTYAAFTTEEGPPPSWDPDLYQKSLRPAALP